MSLFYAATQRKFRFAKDVPGTAKSIIWLSNYEGIPLWPIGK